MGRSTKFFLVFMTLITIVFQQITVLAEEPAESDEPAEATDEVPPTDESETGGVSIGETERFNIFGAERPTEAILAYDIDSRAQVDREDPQADFWLKSNDPRVAGSNYGVEALNGALVAPEHVGQPPDSVPEGSFVSFGGDVPQDQTVPCKTSSGRLCELSARYFELSTGGSDVVVTIILH